MLWAVALAIAEIAQGSPYVGEKIIGDGIVCAIGVALLAKVHRHFLPRFKRTPLLAFVVIAALSYWLTIVAAFMLVIGFFTVLTTRSVPALVQAEAQLFAQDWETLVYPFLIAMGLVFVMELSRRIGPRRLFNGLTGRYRLPREEERIFLFLDLKDSTPLAERLGAVKFSYLLRDFFEDLTEPVLETGAEVVGYVGDEAILSWPVARGLEDSNPLRCYMLFKEAIAENSENYVRLYGVSPEFKGAIHVGPVVATEVGQIKTEVVLHGDALNTAARILGECNSLGAELLLSEAIAKQMGPVEGIAMESLGGLQLRGKGEPVGIVRATVSLKPATAKKGEGG